MATVPVSTVGSGRSSTCKPLARRYSVMPSTVVTRVMPCGNPSAVACAAVDDAAVGEAAFVEAAFDEVTAAAGFLVAALGLVAPGVAATEEPARTADSEAHSA